jgi:hypothetical protein
MATNHDGRDRAQPSTRRLFDVRPGRELHSLQAQADADSGNLIALYARAYWESADMLVTQLERAGTIQQQMTLPVAFLYRHAVELFLKGILVECERLARIKGDHPEVFRENHSLRELLGSAERASAKGGRALSDFLRSDPGLFARVRVDVEAIDRVDPGSFAFRYPMLKRGSAGASFRSALPPTFRFDIVTLKERIQELLDTLDTFLFALGNLDS